MTWAAVAGGGIAAAGSIAGSFLGGSSSGAASEEALAWAKKMFKMQMAEYHAELGREEPFRQAALERTQFGNNQLSTIQDRLDHPTLSPGYNLAMKTGLDALRTSYSTDGSPSSGPSQVAGAKFAEGLSNDELSRFNENLYRAAGFQAGMPGSQAPGILNTAANTGNAIPGLIQNTGNVAGGTANSIGNLLGQFGLFSGSKFGGPGGNASGNVASNQYVDPTTYNPYAGIAY